MHNATAHAYEIQRRVVAAWIDTAVVFALDDADVAVKQACRLAACRGGLQW